MLAYAPMLPHCYYVQNYASICHQGPTQVLPPLSFPPHQLQLSYRVPHSKHLTPLPATDPGGTITMVTASGRSFTRQIRTEDTAVQETNPATDPGGTITMVTASGRSFTRQIRTEDTAVQETNPATPGQLVLGN